MARTRKYRSPGVQLLDQATVPIYLLDATRRIAYCNSACAQWLQCEVEALFGRRCDYHSAGDATVADRLAAGLCPPPTAFAGQRCRARVGPGPDNGPASPRTAEFIPLGRAGEEPIGVLAVVADGAAVDTRATADLPEAQQLHADLQRLRARLAMDYDLDRLVGASAAMERVQEQVRLAAAAVVRVVVTGPPGSGREHVARTIHSAQTATRRPYLVPLACPLLDAELLESTVTPFVRSCAELNDAQPATLLLLEVDQLPEDAQAALLGFLQIAELQLHTLATSRESLLSRAVRGQFRAELAQALSTLVIEIPPLSERMEDVPLLAQAALERVNARGQRQLAGLEEAAVNCLLRYSWPGNADELFQLLEAAHAAATSLYITERELPDRIHAALSAAEFPPRAETAIQLDDFLARVERELMQRALRVAKGNRAHAARLLGISRTRLLRRLDALEIS